MPRVYAYTAHSYTHFTDNGGTEYRWPANGWRDVPDDVAAVVCAAHPQKLVRLRPGEDRPDENTAVEPEPVVEKVEESAKPKIPLFRSVLNKKP